jgi:hypothetical protein
MDTDFNIIVMTVGKATSSSEATWPKAGLTAPQMDSNRYFATLITYVLGSITYQPVQSSLEQQDTRNHIFMF